MKNDRGEPVYLDDLLSAIMSADTTDLEDIMCLVRRRYAQLFPEWEVYHLSLEKGKNRAEQLDRMITILEQWKGNI